MRVVKTASTSAGSARLAKPVSGVGLEATRPKVTKKRKKEIRRADNILGCLSER